MEDALVQDERRYGQCDESKCVSFGGWKNVSLLPGLPFVNPFTCYGDDGGWYPRACADGYVPVVVDDEPDIRSADWDGNSDEQHAVPVSYFTCCPPPLTERTAASDTNDNNTVVVVRRCSDPMIVPLTTRDTDIDAICGSEETRIYPRQMKTNWMTAAMGLSYQCCDSPFTNSTFFDSNENGANNDSNSNSSDTTTHFLDDTECVPYTSDYYGQAAANVVNVFGMIVPTTCDFSDGSFSFPKQSSASSSAGGGGGGGRYECCRNGPATIATPFVQDSVFKLQIYPSLVFTSIGAITSLILMLSLVIPLWKELRSSSSSSSRSSRSSRTRRSAYNTCNLYLVYLAGLDLAYCLYGVIKYGSFVNQRLIWGDPAVGPPPQSSPSAFFYVIFMMDNIINPPYIMANLYINAIVCYQVLLLLKSSKRAIRVKPPSLRRVSLQGGVVCLLAIAYGSGLFALRNACRRALERGDLSTPANVSRNAYRFAFWMGLPPFAYVFFSVAVIWWRGYMPPLRKRRKTRTRTTSLSSSGRRDSSNSFMTAVRDQAVRELALYLLRIVFVFVGFFIPGTVMSFLPRSHLELGRYWTISNWLVAIQPTATFCVILSKSDVRKHIRDLLTLSVVLKTAKRASPSTNDGRQSSFFLSRYGNSGNFSSNGQSSNSEVLVVFEADPFDNHTGGDTGGDTRGTVVGCADENPDNVVHAEGDNDRDVENSDADHGSITDGSRSARHGDDECESDSNPTQVEP